MVAVPATEGGPLETTLMRPSALGGSGSPRPLFGPWRRADRRDQRGTEVFLRAANQLGGEVDGNSEADEPEHHASKTLYGIG